MRAAVVADGFSIQLLYCKGEMTHAMNLTSAALRQGADINRMQGNFQNHDSAAVVLLTCSAISFSALERDRQQQPESDNMPLGVFLDVHL